MFEVPEADALDPMGYYTRWVEDETVEELSELRDYKPSMAFLYRLDEKLKAGRRILGTCYMPQVQGELSPLFDWLLERELGYLPHFLIVLDKSFWVEETDDDGRRALMLHELLHARIKRDQYGAPSFNRQTGEPNWSIRGHDIEEFNAVVRRFGAWQDDVAAFLVAAREGGA